MGGGRGGFGDGGQEGDGDGGQGKVAKEQIAKEKCKALDVKSFFPPTQALFSSLVRSHPPNFPKLPKTFQSGWSWLVSH
jgi:hypothetical protein